MRVCEVCGCEEKIENKENELIQTGLLHICESCQNDRKVYSFDHHAR